MSHNIIKIGESNPDQVGTLAVKVRDFVGNPSNRNVLGYTTSADYTHTLSPRIERDTIASLIVTSGGTVSAYAYDVSDLTVWQYNKFNILDTNYITSNSATGSYVPFTSSSWVKSLTLNSTSLQGKALRVEACHMAGGLTGSEYIKYQWGIGTDADLTTYTPIGNIAEQNEHYNQKAYGHYVVGTTDVYLGLKVVDVNGTVTNMNNAGIQIMSYINVSIL